MRWNPGGGGEGGCSKQSWQCEWRSREVLLACVMVHGDGVRQHHGVSRND
jgi:hypothetical protein